MTRSSKTYSEINAQDKNYEIFIIDDSGLHKKKIYELKFNKSVIERKKSFDIYDSNQIRKENILT